MPRQILPGRVYMLTRRCRDRRFLLRPDHPTNLAFLYCLALASVRTNVGVVSFVANSNHWHGVLVDNDGRIPEFARMFHLLLAKHQNHLRNRWENFWSTEQVSLVELTNPDDIIAKIGYVLCNPVKDHLVERAHHWPGASSLGAMRDDGTITVRRPHRFFDKAGNLPDVISLKLCLPPGFEDRRQFMRQVEDIIATLEAQAALDRRQRGIRVMGRKAILAQHWDDRPDSKEPHRNLSPRLACRNQWTRAERLQQNKDWLRAYRDARELWLNGDTDVVFPPGTYWLRRFASVTCADCA